MYNSFMRILKVVLTFLLFMSTFLPANAIKIGLLTEANRAYIGASTVADVVDVNTNKLLFTMNKLQGYDFKSNGKNIIVKIGGEWKSLQTNSIVIKPEIDGFVSVKRKWYRGFFRVISSSSGITVINDVELESYLRGVVPAEMPPAWEKDAHKAQAIAARSYAVANLGKRAKFGYDLNDTEADQVYNGASCETPQTNIAVEETSGIVLICDNKVIPAYYSASAGGRTLSAKDVWNMDVAFTHSVPSYDDNVKKKGHGVGMSQHGANNLAKKGYNSYQILNHFYANTKFARLNKDVYK